jgi:hypothetical protein
MSLKNMKIFGNHENRRIFVYNLGKMVRAGAGVFDKLEPEPHKNGPAPQDLKYWCMANLCSVGAVSLPPPLLPAVLPGTGLPSGSWPGLCVQQEHCWFFKLKSDIKIL